MSRYGHASAARRADGICPTSGLTSADVGTALIVGFSGADRRAGSAAEDQVAAISGNCGRFTAAAALWAVGLAAIACAPAVSTLPLGSVLGDGWPIAMGSAVFGFATIAVWIGAWAFSGRSWPAYVALALVPWWAMAQLGASPEERVNHDPIGALAVLVPAVAALVLFDRARRAPEVNTALHPGRTLAVMVAGAAVVLAAVVLGPRSVVTLSRVDVIAVGSLAATVWLVVASIAFRGARAPVADRRYLALGLTAFGLGVVDRTVATVSSNHALNSWASLCGRTVALVGWALLFTVALRSLDRARAVAGRRQEELRAARDEMLRVTAEDRRQFDEARHDLRSLVAGIHGASATLSHYRAFLEPREQLELESALVAEITRLQHALSSTSAAPSPFGIRALIEPVVMAERACGAVIRVEVPDAEVIARPEAVAALVQNLLTNSRRHAPGASIAVTGQVAGEALLLVVGDNGPGLSEAMRARVSALFAGGTPAADEAQFVQLPPSPRNRRSLPAPSSAGRRGLGLAICARLAAEQGAGLRLLEGGVGTRVELSLPLASGAVPGGGPFSDRSSCTSDSCLSNSCMSDAMIGGTR
jgi:signal transduction histidine kinase